MGYRHTREQVLQGALDTAFDAGLSKLTFGRVATHLGISDRIVVYYFPTKAVLIAEVLNALAGELQATLGPGLAAAATDSRSLVTNAWPIVATPSADPIFALFFQAAGLATSGTEPYTQLVPQLVHAWVEWAANLLAVGSPSRRRSHAAAAVATLDGLLLMRQLCGPRTANAAFRAATAE